MKKFLSLTSFILALQLLYGQQVTPPAVHFGFEMGANYHLANYTQMERYFLQIAQESDRVVIEKAGLTEEGRQQYLLVVSSPENLTQLEKYRKISQRMGRAEDLTEQEARELSKQGKPIVWIDGGMHSNEMVGSHQLVETLYQLASSEEADIKRYLDEVIVLMWHVNPDGQELLADWYMQYEDQEDRNMSIPRLYQKYVGHDNNRDFFMYNMKEAQNLARVMYIDWLPQIVYNHHQTSPQGTVVAGPPYRDPFNHVFDPLLVSGIDGVGFAMIDRLHQENKPGYVRMDQSGFSTWWNGGLRTAPYFHNMIGILTEITGNPTPSEIALVPDRQVPRNGLPYPVDPQPWTFRQSIDYSVSLNFAILDYAARNGDRLLYNFYKMGRNSIEKGNRDQWTKYPRYVAEMEQAYRKDTASAESSDKPDSSPSTRPQAIPTRYFDAVFQHPENRDPRAYIIPSDQADFGTAIKFVNALIRSGVQAQRATTSFTVAGKTYESGSLVVRTNQAFRPQILDMFEPQDHPHDVEYPGGPPVRPYDAAGWTLALQMGVQFDRIMDDFQAPLVKLPYGELITREDQAMERSKSGYLINGQANDAFVLVNRLLKNGVQVYRDKQTADFFVDENAFPILEQSVDRGAFGDLVEGSQKRPNDLQEYKALHIGLFDYYGGSMPSGWVRWLLEQYEFDYRLVYPNDIDQGRISELDILLFIGPGVPSMGSPSRSRQPDLDLVPEEFRHMLGTITADKSIPMLRDFVDKGGQILTVGTASELVYHFQLPIVNPLTSRADGKSIRLPSTAYYIPTSILKGVVQPGLLETQGVQHEANLVFNNSPVFAFEETDSLYSLGKFTSETPLLSGWAHGQHHLKNTHFGLAAHIGKGKLVAFGPEITNRAQSHGTFKLLFNQLYQW